MNKNQKIAVGCGVAGCLGLIVIVIFIVVLGVLGYVSLPGVSSSNRNYNFNQNSNYNSNTNTDSSSNSDSSSSSTMSEDDKHKLFQAAGVTKDNQLILRVLDKIGYPNGMGAGYDEFLRDHYPWALRNTQFIQSVMTNDKARAYVEAHLDD